MDSLNKFQMSRFQTPTPGRYNLQHGNNELLTQTERLLRGKCGDGSRMRLA